MGGAYFLKQEARENLLGQIVRNEFKYLVCLVGIKEDNGRKARGHIVFLKN